MAEIDRSSSAQSEGLFSDPPEFSPEAQRRPVVDDSAAAMQRLRIPFEADPADALDQSRTVALDEDEYRR
jgi:hypothetical protein